MLYLILKAAISGAPFWAALGAGCLLTIGLYPGMTAVGPRFGLKL